MSSEKGRAKKRRNYYTGTERGLEISTILGAGTTDTFFGNGSDGDLDLSGYYGYVYSLSRDMYFENVNFPSGYGVIYTEGFRLFVNGTLYLDSYGYSRIQNSGIDIDIYSSPQYGASGAPAGTVGGGADGGDAGVLGDNISYALGGAGGAGSSKSGGSPIPPSTVQGGTKVANNISNAILGIVAGSGYHMFSGGAGGGGGNSYGGGGGGGVCLVVARNIESTTSGSCMSLGGSDWSGDGGSGGGGAVIVVTTSISGSGTFYLGASGGRNGSTGNTYLIEV